MAAIQERPVSMHEYVRYLYDVPVGVTDWGVPHMLRIKKRLHQTLGERSNPKNWEKMQ